MTKNDPDAMRAEAAAIAASHPDIRTPDGYRHEAASLRLMATLWEASAHSAESSYSHLGGVGLDFGQRVALRLRECAREAVWAATQLDVYADEARDVTVSGELLPCQGCPDEGAA